MPAVEAVGGEAVGLIKMNQDRLRAAAVFDLPPTVATAQGRMADSDPLTTVLKNTIGVWLLVLLFQSILYGIALLQIFFYFHWYPNDSRWTSGTVILVTVLETLQSALFFTGVYETVINGFASLSFLDLMSLSWTIGVELEAVYLSTFIVQIYYATQIYRFHQKDNLVPLAIGILSLAALAAGSARVYVSVRLQLDIVWAASAAIAQAVLTLLADILITGRLWHLLKLGKDASNRMDHVTDFLLKIVINRGFLTMLVAALNLILFTLRPNTYDYMSVLLLSGKLYLNSMLAMLNTRKHARKLGGFGSVAVVSEMEFMHTSVQLAVATQGMESGSGVRPTVPPIAGRNQES
uniref:DUF6534 domain-containing protein n=1 Tax=Mycena chlorophos TaxID=658473 RepID=A0ABQ0KYA6_MYCCL|nr:predicted protein [Mycena chlorophos]